MRTQRMLAAVVVVIAVLALVVGIIYLTTEAKSLPSFLGQVHGATGKRSHRGIAALVVGVLLLAGGFGLFVYRPRRSVDGPQPGP
jgi:amino acid permease